MTKFSGTFPALVTPFDQNDDVNETALDQIVEYHIQKNVDGFYVGGTTGEGIYMSIAERMKVSETVVKVCDNRVPVMVHIGAVSVKDAITLAEHSREIGASAVSSILLPQYNTIESLYHYFVKIMQSVPDFPVFGYALRSPVNVVELMKKLSEIDNFVGLKYSGSNMFELRQLIEIGDENWIAFSGMDEQCVFAIMQGVSGNIGSTLNFMPGVYREIHQLCQNGKIDLAHCLQLRANRVTEIMVNFGFSGALKTVMGELGFDCGSPRLPNLPIAKEKIEKLMSELKNADFWELAKM